VDGGSGEKRLADSGSEPENHVPYAVAIKKGTLMSYFSSLSSWKFSRSAMREEEIGKEEFDKIRKDIQQAS
jgi:hypothetical protein